MNQETREQDLAHAFAAWGSYMSITELNLSYLYNAYSGRTLMAAVPPQRRRPGLSDLHGWKEIVVAMWVGNEIHVRNNSDDHDTYLQTLPKRSLYQVTAVVFDGVCKTISSMNRTGLGVSSKSPYRIHRTRELDLSMLEQWKLVQATKGI